MTELRSKCPALRRNEPANAKAMHAIVSDDEVVKMRTNWPYPAELAFTGSRCVPMDRARGFSGAVRDNGKIIAEWAYVRLSSTKS